MISCWLLLVLGIGVRSTVLLLGRVPPVVLGALVKKKKKESHDDPCDLNCLLPPLLNWSPSLPHPALLLELLLCYNRLCSHFALFTILIKSSVKAFVVLVSSSACSKCLRLGGKSIAFVA